MMRNLFLLLAICLIVDNTFAQQSYQFSEIIDLEATPVISQGRTGTCWSFSSTSFLESEIIRLTGKPIDLSEMYTVRNTYPLKAENYVMRQGKAQFGEGGLAHDVMHSVKKFGLVPEDVFSGLKSGNTSHNHAEMVAVLEAMLKTYVDNPAGKLSKNWKNAIESVLDVYLGENPNTFTYDGKNYTPQSFLKMTQIDPDNYVTLTSFTQAPFYSSFILNIPDNWSNGTMYNVPVDELVSAIDYALQQGYTVELDCDVSEKTFSSKDGVAVVPADSANNVKALQGIYPEMNVTQSYRQDEFENFDTTDDHLMHITGLLKDQNGTKYYKVKNSWGTNPDYTAHNGYVYFSESYVKLKTISITLHKDAIPKKTSDKLNL